MQMGPSSKGGITVRERETTITQKGQVTIPVEVRATLGLKPKDKVIFEVTGDVATIRRAPSKILRWYGSVTPRQRPEDFQKLREEFEQGVAEEVDQEG
jgi:AbrB family looped-hinge helix DNA binding protein